LIKVNRETAFLLITMVRWAQREMTEGAVAAMRSSVSGERNHSHPYATQIRTAAMNRQVPSLEEALNQLCQATWGAESAEGGGNLIEDIAKLLQTQVPRNIMSGEVLARLRNLILLPSEVAAAQSLQQGDLTCISCGRRITQASVCSYPGSGVIYCTNCYRPSYVGCTEADCTGQVVIPDRISGFFHEPHKCSIHREANAHTPSTSIGLDSIAVPSNAFDNIRAQRVARSLGEMVTPAHPAPGRRNR
jgi:hypothetical protein